jgi:ribosome-binding protein aMBF1 (putative translation factor)
MCRRLAWSLQLFGSSPTFYLRKASIESKCRLDRFDGIEYGERVATSIARCIARARKQAGLTPDEFAAKCGASRSSVCEWELGDHTPRLEMLRRIAKVCGIPLSELLGES